MRAPHWHTNPDYSSVPTIDIGDIIHLEFCDTFEYVAKAKVLSIGQRLTAVVNGIFDAEDRVNITSSNVLQLVGKHIECERKSIRKVIKPPGA